MEIPSFSDHGRTIVVEFMCARCKKTALRPLKDCLPPDKLLEMYKYVDGRLRGVEGQISQQAVYNATNTAALNCMQGQIAQLLSLTKIVVPNSSICPGWGAVNVTPETTGT